MSERVYIPYQPVIGEIPPEGVQYQMKITHYPNEWKEWNEEDPPLKIDDLHLSEFRFRVPAPEEDDELWEDVPVGELLKAGDRFSFNGIDPFEDVAHRWHNTEHSVAAHRVRRRKAVETPKPPQKPLNTYLPYLLEKADKATKGDQAKREQINAAKAVFAKRISEIMGVTE